MKVRKYFDCTSSEMLANLNIPTLNLIKPFSSSFQPIHLRHIHLAYSKYTAQMLLASKVDLK